VDLPLKLLARTVIVSCLCIYIYRLFINKKNTHKNRSAIKIKHWYFMMWKMNFQKHKHYFLWDIKHLSENSQKILLYLISIFPKITFIMLLYVWQSAKMYFFLFSLVIHQLLNECGEKCEQKKNMCRVCASRLSINSKSTKKLFPLKWPKSHSRQNCLAQAWRQTDKKNIGDSTEFPKS
jgi:hypothetical protein